MDFAYMLDEWEAVEVLSREYDDDRYAWWAFDCVLDETFELGTTDVDADE